MATVQRHGRQIAAPNAAVASEDVDTAAGIWIASSRTWSVERLSDVWAGEVARAKLDVIDQLVADRGAARDEAWVARFEWLTGPEREAAVQRTPGTERISVAKRARCGPKAEAWHASRAKGRVRAPGTAL